MGKFRGVLLATDFDDTLFRSNITGPGVSEAEKRGEPVVFGRNKEALDYFLAQAGRFTVSTGRAFQTFAPYVDRVPMNAPAVLANGAIIYDFGRNMELSHAYLPDCVVLHAAALAGAFPQLGFETHLGDLIYTFRPNEITWRHIHKLGCSFVECGFEEMPLPCPGPSCWSSIRTTTCWSRPRAGSTRPTPACMRPSSPTTTCWRSPEPEPPRAEPCSRSPASWG